MHEVFFLPYGIDGLFIKLQYHISVPEVRPTKTFQACYEKARTKAWLLLHNVLSDIVTFVMYIVCLLSPPP